jgi:hypothetical protein
MGILLLPEPVPEKYGYPKLRVPDITGTSSGLDV